MMNYIHRVKTLNYPLILINLLLIISYDYYSLVDIKNIKKIEENYDKSKGR